MVGAIALQRLGKNIAIQLFGCGYVCLQRAQIGQFERGREQKLEIFSLCALQFGERLLIESCGGIPLSKPVVGARFHTPRAGEIVAFCARQLHQCCSAVRVLAAPLP